MVQVDVYMSYIQNLSLGDGTSGRLYVLHPKPLSGRWNLWSFQTMGNLKEPHTTFHPILSNNRDCRTLRLFFITFHLHVLYCVIITGCLALNFVDSVDYSQTMEYSMSTNIN